ncbi:hypothetical protein ES332_A12G060700v1 [Gossypium tomentosum]|uniref:Secreted protein n=1 Tax=Gossypium tomentosum TaxID=34277 RepID=A0A5D2MTF4_GOSTO|nr:hypothetical protein ES332_A12G060700v1 [Gossypium tomentosum]
MKMLFFFFPIRYCSVCLFRRYGVCWHRTEVRAWRVVWRNVVWPLVRAVVQGDPCPRVCQNWAQFLGHLGYWAMSFCKWTCNLGLETLGLIWFDFGL